MRLWKLSDSYIREAFSYLCQLDTEDFVQAGPFLFKGWGNELHIKYYRQPVDQLLTPDFKGSPFYECVIKEGIENRVYVDEWRAQVREVQLEFGYRHKSHWWEVYRSGRHVTSPTFVHYLKQLYGEGPNGKVTSPE